VIEKLNTGRGQKIPHPRDNGPGCKLQAPPVPKEFSAPEFHAAEMSRHANTSRGHVSYFWDTCQNGLTGTKRPDSQLPLSESGSPGAQGKLSNRHTVNGPVRRPEMQE
jgi:hypothetical protein